MYSYVFTYYNSDLRTIDKITFQQGNLQGYVDKLSECLKDDKTIDKLDGIEKAKNSCEDTMKAIVSLIHGGQN